MRTLNCWTSSSATYWIGVSIDCREKPNFRNSCWMNVRWAFQEGPSLNTIPAGQTHYRHFPKSSFKVLFATEIYPCLWGPEPRRGREVSRWNVPLVWRTFAGRPGHRKQRWRAGSRSAGSRAARARRPISLRWRTALLRWRLPPSVPANYRQSADLWDQVVVVLLSALYTSTNKRRLVIVLEL